MALLIAIAMVSGQQFSGVNVVLFYAENIFIMAGTTISSSVCTIIIGLCLFGFGLFTAPLVKFFGMKNLLIFSGLGMTIFQVLYMNNCLICLKFTDLILNCALATLDLFKTCYKSLNLCFHRDLLQIRESLTIW